MAGAPPIKPLRQSYPVIVGIDGQPRTSASNTRQCLSWGFMSRQRNRARNSFWRWDMLLCRWSGVFRTCTRTWRGSGKRAKGCQVRNETVSSA
jgi:hypothetical protein